MNTGNPDSPDGSTADPDPAWSTFDIGVIGGGSAMETLTRELGGRGLSIVVFEPKLVGGECPFHACMPSKSLLHDAAAGTSWEHAVARRTTITNGLDDTGHADDLTDLGVELVRERAEVLDEHTVRAGGALYRVEHLVVATGATPVIPDIDGIGTCHDLVWTSEDALTSDDRPDRLVVIGSGVVGIECSFLYRGFGTDVVLIDNSDRSFDTAPPRVSEVLDAALHEAGVDVRHGVEATSMRETAGEVSVTLSDGTSLVADRVMVAIGRRPATTGFGLDRLGLDPDEPLPLEPNGKVRCPGSVWAMGDVAGRGQYTHLANHQARVIADHLGGTGTRTFGDVVLPSCMFSQPPLVQVGPDWVELGDDPDIVAAGFDLGTFPRSLTDDLPDGHLWVAARRSTGCLVAATGIGPKFDELVHALVVAIDGRVPVARLRQSMQPFPTIGEILGPVFAELHDQLTPPG